MSELPDSLRDYVRTVDSALERAGVTPLARHGIIRDLEGQIAEMRSEEGLSDTAILAGLDDPESFAATYAENHPSTTPIAAEPRPRVRTPDARGAIIYTIVALLAAAAILVETATRMSALHFFNPIPTYMHLAVLATVPVILLATTVLLSTGRASVRPGWLCFANGWLVAIAAWYSIPFFPLVPIAFMGIVYLGLGLLPLAPLLTCMASLCQAMQLRRQAKSVTTGGLFRRWISGFMLAILILGGWYGYTATLDQAMRMAADPNTEAQSAGLRRLRQFHGEQYVLSRCFSRERNGNAAIRSNRVTYYRLTGKDYREAKKPSWHFALKERNWEDGGDSVGGKSDAVALRSAVYDISVASSDMGGNAGPGVAYAELTLEFANTGVNQEEARCQVILPPGGVASRLTLWIDGEEREAAFGKRSVVREAYTKVVSRQLDPALLTTAGPDRVLLQCFPIPPGQTMRVKAGFSLPVTPDGGQGHLLLPYLAERNFAVELEKGVSVWAESDAPLSANAALSTTAEKEFTVNGDSGKRKKAFAVRGRVAMDDLAGARISLPLPDAPATYRAELAGVGATSELLRGEAFVERLVAVVLDASRQFDGAWNTPAFWDGVLEKIPEGCRVALFAGETTLPPLSAGEAARQWPDALARLDCPGADGQTENLEKAWDLCEGVRDAAVLWIHGAMPVDFAGTSGMAQRFRRRPRHEGGPVVYSAQVRAGPNRIEETLGESDSLARLPVWLDKTIGENVARLFANMNRPEFARERYRFGIRDDAGGGDERYGHAVRLAMAREVERRVGQNGGKNAIGVNDALVADALRLRLVTRTTGAVVLENAAQYEANSLDPSAAADAVPTIPEPEEWGMLAIAALFVVALYRKRKRQGLGT